MPLLDEVQAKGIVLAVHDSAIHYQGPESALTPALIGRLKEHKAEIISLMKCGQCGTLLSGPLNKWWRILDNGRCTYLCSASCVFEAWPWRMDGGGP
jgi:TubC N-terminal docking domain